MRGQVFERTFFWWFAVRRHRGSSIRYEPGVLEVVVYKDGREWARDMVKTTGAPARLEATAETVMVASDGEDVCYVNVSVRDAEGMVVLDAKLPVKFEMEGPGEIVATDNGDETDFDDYHSPSRRTFNGWVQAIVRAHPGSAGNMRVRVSSVGLAPSIIEVGAKGEAGEVVRRVNQSQNERIE